MCKLIIAVAHNGLPTFNFDNLFLQFCMLNFIIHKNVRRLSNVFLFVCLFFEVFEEVLPEIAPKMQEQEYMVPSQSVNKLSFTCTPRSIPSVSWIACAIIKAHGIITVSIGSAVVGVV